MRMSVICKYVWKLRMYNEVRETEGIGRECKVFVKKVEIGFFWLFSWSFEYYSKNLLVVNKIASFETIGSAKMIFRGYLAVGIIKATTDCPKQEERFL